jgi:hypothetical protein
MGQVTPVKCDQCDKVYVRPSYFAAHMAIHAQEKKISDDKAKLEAEEAAAAVLGEIAGNVESALGLDITTSTWVPFPEEEPAPLPAAPFCPGAANFYREHPEALPALLTASQVLVLPPPGWEESLLEEESEISMILEQVTSDDACEVCDYVCSGVTTLADHMKEAHSPMRKEAEKKEEEKECEKCVKKDDIISELKKKLAEVKKSELPKQKKVVLVESEDEVEVIKPTFNCSKCKKKFASKASLKSHIILFHPTQTHCCQVCKAVFHR